MRTGSRLLSFKIVLKSACEIIFGRIFTAASEGGFHKTFSKFVNNFKEAKKVFKSCFKTLKTISAYMENTD
jgi:hypothetical protein